MRSLFQLAFMLSGFFAHAAVIGVDLGVRFAYADLDQACATSGIYKGFSVTGTLKDGKMVQATFRSLADRSASFDLLPEELSGIETKTDAIGDVYIVTLPVSVRLFHWMIYHVDDRFLAGGCYPWASLKTPIPNGTVYRFTYQTTTTYSAPIQRLKGERADGSPYVVKLGFYQVQSVNN